MSETDNMSKVIVHSSNLNLDFTVFVQNETVSEQKCFVLTVHDIGSDHRNFKNFVDSPSMEELKKRLIWLHVVLPGQEENARDLDLVRYPSLMSLASELVLVLDHFDIARVVCFGEGAGANICAKFALIHSTRCLGIALIHPMNLICSTSLVGNWKDKMNLRRISRIDSGELSPSEERFLLFHKFGQKSTGLMSDQFIAYIEKRNQKNLSLFMESFYTRSSISEKMSELTVDVLTIVGKNFPQASESRKFYKALESSRKDNLKTLVNCPFIEISYVSDVLNYGSGKLAVSLKFFLQGMGLVPAIPLISRLNQKRDSLCLTMQDADKPRRISVM